MTIPASRWHDNGDGTAWLIVSANEAQDAYRLRWTNGRHCFDIEVGGECKCPRSLLDTGAFIYEHTGTCLGHLIHGYNQFSDGSITYGRTYRVHVLDIVPVVEVDKHNTVGRYIVQMPTKRTWLMDNSEFPVKQEEVTLPDDAKPGDTAVHLKVVT